MQTARPQLPPVSALLFDRPIALPAWNTLDLSTAVLGAAQPPTVGEPAIAPLSSPVSGHVVGDSPPLTRQKRPPAKDMKANLRRSRHRDCEKRETMFLQAYRHELEGELQRLQLARAERSRAQLRQLVKGSLLDERSSWRALALLRRRERKQAEQENARLRALWKMQLRLAAQMEQALSVPQSVGPANGRGITFTDADSEVFAALFNDLEGVYRQSGSMLQESGLEHLSEGFFHRIERHSSREAQREVGSGDTKVMAVRLMCSKFETVQERMLMTVVAAILKRGGLRYDTGEKHDQDTVAMKVRVLPQDEAQDNECVEIFMVTRKYMVAPDRAVYVWRSLKVGDGCLAGIVESESSLCAVSRSQYESKRSFVRRLRRLEPMARSPAKRGEVDERELMDRFNLLSLTHVENDIDAVMRTIENYHG